jgi:hypothetical protein
MQFGLWFQLPPDRRPQEIKDYEGGLAIAVGLAFGIVVGMLLLDFQLKTILYTVLAYVVLVFFGAHLSNKEVLETSRKIAYEHRDTLKARRAEVTLIDAYGSVDETTWTEEKYHFFTHVIKPALKEKKFSDTVNERTLKRIFAFIDEVAPFTPDLQKPIYLR